MCGIVGRVELGGLDRGRVGPAIDRALERLAPRGPDGGGTWFDGRCALGHRRLAIVDLSPAGAQPMLRDGLAIVYNGMVYNFRSLRRELEAAGESFRSDSDTEVLLAGWRRWGPGLLPRLSGMFAFALWDGGTGELVLARDRFGKKPLLFRRAGGRLVFASDLVALQLADETRGSVDPDALGLYLALRYLPEPFAILEGVAKLPPGHLARFSSAGLAISRWYDPGREAGPAFEDETAAAGALRRTVDAAVAERLVADVPVGAFLSGGLDSAVVTASMVRAADRVRTFTVGFEGAPDYYEERPAARALARHLGTDHTEIPVSADDMRGVLDGVFDGLDEPFGDSSAVPQFIVSRETRRHVTVALSGDGGDEVFAGYRKYQGELYAERYRRLPARLRSRVIEPLIGALPEGKRGPWLERARRLRRFVAHAAKDPAARQAGWARNLSPAELSALLIPPAAGSTPESIVAALRAQSGAEDPINAMLAADMGLTLSGDMLVKVDRMGMAHALEVRCPLLDHRVVACAAAMPGRFKLRPGAGKHILRLAFRDRLPAEALARPKKGFEVPVADWLRGPLADLARRAADPARLRRQGLFRPELPARWIADLAGGRRDTSWQLWTLVAFQAWWERHMDPGAA